MVDRSRVLCVYCVCVLIDKLCDALATLVDAFCAQVKQLVFLFCLLEDFAIKTLACAG